MWYYLYWVNIKIEVVQSFVKVDFVIHHTLRRGNGVPMDKALEKEYNKPAEGAEGVISNEKEQKCS